MKVKLSEVSSGFTKNIAQKDLDNNNGCYPIYGASGYIKNINFYISDKPYIGIVKDGSGVGRVNIYPAYSSLLGTMQYVVPNDNMDIAYLMYALRYMKLGSLYSGAAIPHIYYKNYQRNELNYREKNEQKSISTQLTQIENAILVCNAKIIALDELVKSRFIEMFGDPQNNNKQFPTKKLIDVVTLQRGHDLPVQNRDSHGSVPVYGSNGVLGFHTIAKCDRGIITGRSGTIGEVYVSEEPFWPLNTTLYSNNTHGNNLIYLKYLLMFFNLKRFKSGAGVPTLNRNEFHGKEIMDVPIELQNDFADFVKLIDKSKFIVQKQIDDLQELLDSKMDEYFG